MSRIVQALAGGFLWLLSLLPFWALYLLSDAVWLLLYYVVRYRRHLVRANLEESFPEMTPRERKIIERKFYRNFSDYIFETVKMLTVSGKKLAERLTYENSELIYDYLEQGRLTVGYYSHCGNWEWVTHMAESFAAKPQYWFGEIYRPLKNKWMDSLMLRLRTRFGSHCVAKATAFREVVRLKASHVPALLVFMSDQKPSHGDRVHYVEFLSQKTAVITGTEMVAMKAGSPVVYLDIEKTGRGRYTIRFVPMSDDASQTAEYQLTDQYFKLLEQTIRRNPSIWLWTHNRWKYTRNKVTPEA